MESSGALKATGIERVDRSQRVVLTVLALAGVVGFELALMLPWMLALGLGALWFNRVYAYVGSAIVLLILWWSFQPEPQRLERGLQRAEHPMLFTVLDGLAQRIDAPPVDEVVLDADFNAGAVLIRRRWRPWRTKQVLVLGIPLLACLPPPAVQAVIAHELGHFSHRHGRLGHWLYRARSGWLRFAGQASQDDSILDRAAARFAAWFGPWLARKSFAYARACEYEADAFAADVVTRDVMAAALAVVEARGQVHQRFMREGLDALQARLAEPPVDITARIVEEQQALALAQAALPQRETRDEADASDTHPPSMMRIAALHSTPAAAFATAATWGGPSAGESWLQGWADIVRQHDAEFVATHRRAWRDEHLRLQAQQLRLQGLRDAHEVCEERAWLAWRVGDATGALAAAQAVLDSTPRSALALHVRGVARLSLGDAEGRVDLEACLRADKAWIAPCRAALAAMSEAHIGPGERERNAVLLERAVAQRRAAVQALLEEFRSGQADEAPVDATSRSILAAALSDGGIVAQAWLVGRTGHVLDDRVHDAVLLLLRVDPAKLQAEGMDEDDVVAWGQALLQRVLQPQVLRGVWSAYTTEPLAPALETALRSSLESGRGLRLVPQ
jgi:Zn-dependent protease with chaperone function